MSMYGAVPRTPEPKVRFISPYVSEFVGTFLLVFTVGCVSAVGDPAWRATAVACMLMVLVYAFGPVSGGHFNPAVSVSLGLCGKRAWSEVLGYICVQLLGALAAGSACRGIFDQATPFAPVAPFQWWHAGLAEAGYTAMLCFVVNSCAASLRNNPRGDENHFYALAIGFVVVAGGYAVGGISGGAFNPAVVLGLNASPNDVVWALIYTAYQIAGAVVAAYLFYLTRPEDYAEDLPVDISNFKPKLPTRLTSEFLGTFVLVLTVGLNAVTGSRAGPWSAAAALMCMVYSLGNVSGAHFNPAVTLAVVLSQRGKCSAADGLAYACVQAAAGILAGLVVAYFHESGSHLKQAFGLQPGAGYDWWNVAVAELIFTFLLAFVVLSVATATDPPSVTKSKFQFALAIGSCITAGGFAIGAVSGGMLNPAVCLGVATESVVVSSADVAPPFENCMIFAASELAGGILAAVAFFLTHPHEYRVKDLILLTRMNTA